MPKYADIIVNISREELDKTFQYRIPDELSEIVVPGSKVEIPFHNRPAVTGYVISLSDEPKIDETRIRKINGLAKRSLTADDTMMALAAWMKEAYGCTLNQALKTVLPVKGTIRKGKTRVQSVPLPSQEERDAYTQAQLNPEQQEAVSGYAQETEGPNRPCLLFGVTGSGKTEVYMEMIRRCIEGGKQAILLIPEIALTYQNVKRFFLRFGDRVGILNSRQSAGEKYETVRLAKEGKLDLVIGPRSALFVPFPRLGLIIIDEEHEHSYHSDLTPRYHAREVAEKLCELTGASLVLGSATPSLESFSRAESGQYRLLQLPHRAMADAKLPQVYVADLREELKAGNKSVFSRLLREKIEDRLEKKEQIMLFLNRRGYAGFVSCRYCGKPIVCPHCSISMTYHRDGSLHCHYCGYSIPFPETCPSCGSPYIAAFGTGTQKVEAIVQREFPKARVLRMDADTTTGKSGHSRILDAFGKDEADILIGTQMIVKGHDFPRVTLVGVLAADLSLYAPEYDAAERTFQLLTQASGRAGRGSRQGEVVLQTYMPEHYAVLSSAEQDYEAFYREEMAFRRLMHYPPAGGLLIASVSGPDAAGTELKTKALREVLEDTFLEQAPLITGPAEGTEFKRKDVFRQQLLIRHPDAAVLRKIRDYAGHLLGDTIQFDLQ